MAAKKKKKSKKKSTRQSTAALLKSLTVDQLINRGRQFLEIHNARQAIQSVKAALNKGASPDLGHPLLCHAYLQRITQLHDKNLTAEAEATRRQLTTYIPPPDKIEPDLLLALIQGLDLHAAISLYGGFKHSNGPCPPAALWLAGQFMIARDWSLADAFAQALEPDEDMGRIQSAAELMHAGKWEEAQTALAVARQSIFAPMRLFCRAMVCFYQNDPAALKRAAAMMPDTHPLNPLVKRLVEHPRSISALYEGPNLDPSTIDTLLRHLKNGKMSLAQAGIRQLANQIYPEQPEWVRFHILELFFSIQNSQNIDSHVHGRLIQRLLTPQLFDLFHAKIGLLFGKDPFDDLALYLKSVAVEFPDNSSRLIADAEARLLAIEREQAIPPYERNLFNYGQIDFHHQQETMLNMAVKASELDPKNRKAYECVAGLPRYDRPSKNRVTAVLTRMMDEFPADPYPCHELATLFYEKNAYRKAENILAEAMRRAPHDPRVVDRHVVALLVSIQKSLQRQKYHLAKKDLEKAHALAIGQTRLLVIEKQLFFNIITAKASKIDIIAMCDELSSPLEPVEKIRMLMLLMREIDQWPFFSGKSVLKQLSQLLAQWIEQLKQISSAQAMLLLQPIPDDHQPLYAFKHMAPTVLESIPRLFTFIDDPHFFDALEFLLAADMKRPALNTIQFRKQKTKTLSKVKLEFYLVVIRAWSLPFHRGLPKIHRFISGVPNEDISQLRQAARRLAFHANDIYKNALNAFQFTLPGDILGQILGLVGMDDDFENDFDW